MSLREAVTYANSHAGDDTITFDSSLAGQTIVLTNGELDLTDTTGTTTITGLGADRSTISGNNASRVFYINSGATADISGLTITEGNAFGCGGDIDNSGMTIGASAGGGIDNYGTLTITDSAISGNSAPNGFGGGIGNYGALTISGSTISGNSAVFGSGIDNYGTLTITGSAISGNLASDGYGGGIWNYGTSTITDSTISGNSATWGGGIWDHGTSTITGCTISTNSASGCGGGIVICQHSALTITDSAISGNAATEYGGGIYFGGGGFIFVLTNSTMSGNAPAYDGTLTIIDSTISGNSATYGGGVSNGGTVAITDSTISRNSAFGESSGDGGGIYNDGTMTITDSTISGNSAYGRSCGNGGGISNAGTMTITGSAISENSVHRAVHSEISNCGGGISNNGTMTITDSTISGNSAFDGMGGGIFNCGGYDNAELTVTDSTISGNSGCGGGIYNESANFFDGASHGTSALRHFSVIFHTGGYGVSMLSNTIVAGNVSLYSSSPYDICGGVTANYCLIGNTAYTAISSSSENNILNVDALLGPLADNGGPTQTMALLPGSPAIDVGNNLLAVDAQGNPLSNDQRGYARVVNGTVDIGAYESHYPKVTINQASTQADPASTTPINFTVVFNKAVTDFNAGDVTLGGTAPGTLAATVTGNGTTYDVAVSGMTGGGTVIASIAAGKAHDAAGNANSPSTSTDNAVDVVFAPISNIAVTAKTSGDKTTITWMESDSSGIGATTLTIDGAAAKIAKKASGKTAANFSYAGILKAGTHAYTIATKNGSGRSTTYTGTFTVNPTTPVISKIRAKASTSDKMTTITWTVADVDGVGSTALSIDGVIITSGIKQSGKGSSFTYVYTGYFDAGSHTYTIDATDGLGVSAIQAGSSFDVKAATPTIKNVKVTANTSVDKTVITWTVDNLHWGWIALEIDGVAVTSRITQSSSGTSHTFTYWGYYQAGKHAYTIDATDDTVDCISAKQAKGSFTVKPTTPTISNVVVTSTTAANPIAITWNVYDIDGIGTVKLTIDGKTATIAPWGNGYTGSLAAGRHKYVITVTDTCKVSSRIVGRFTVAAASLAAASRVRATTNVRGTVKTDWLIDYDSLIGVAVPNAE